MKSGIFFERDGILNLVKVERQSQVTPLTFEELKLNGAALAPLKKLKAAGFVLLATTNQPGLSRGYQSRRELDRMHEALKRCFPLNDVLTCPHDETDDCPCRKPQPGLLQESAFKYHLDLERCYVVSDKWQDAKMAQVVGATSILLESPWNGDGHHDFVISDLEDLADKILQLHSTSLLAMNQM